MGTVAALGFVASRVARAGRATVLGIYLEHSVSNLTVCKILAKISTSSKRKKKSAERQVTGLTGRSCSLYFLLEHHPQLDQSIFSPSCYQCFISP